MLSAAQKTQLAELRQQLQNTQAQLATASNSLVSSGTMKANLAAHGTLQAVASSRSFC